MHADFVHLRTHSAYSLSEGAIKAEKIAILAQQERMPAAAITDSSNLFGALEFSQACSARGVQPIIGCQLALTRTDPSRSDAPRAAPDALIVLAKDATGFANLRRLSSLSFLDSDPTCRPQISLATLCRHADGLILLTGGANGPLARLLTDGRAADAERLLAQLLEAFGDRTVIELNRHLRPNEAAIEPGLIAWPMRAACRWPPPMIACSPRLQCTRPMTPCSASPNSARCRRPSAAASRPNTGSSPQPRCARCSPICRKPATIPWRSPGAAR